MKKKPKMMKVKGFAIVWPVRNKLMENEGQKAIFNSKKEAVELLGYFPVVSHVLEVVPCTINYSLPLPKK